jgi:hypothetical protein
MPVFMLTWHTDTTQAMLMHACTPHRSHHRTVRQANPPAPQANPPARPYILAIPPPTPQSSSSHLPVAALLAIPAPPIIQLATS